jgi:Bacterial Ig domain
MPRFSTLPFAAAAALSAGALALPAGASAATGDCPLSAPRASVDHAIPGTNLVARDPYGGLLSRNRLFFDFSVRGDKTDLAGVAKVQWALDGTVVREDPTAPYEWKGLSGSDTRMPAGDHQITVTVVPTTGAPASTQFALSATDCQNAFFNAEVAQKRGPALFTFAAGSEGDGEPLTGVGVIKDKNMTAALPASLRGRAIGTLTVLKSGERTGKTYTLKGAATALAKGNLKVRYVPGAKGFLKVTGLPAGTQGVTIRLKSGLVRLTSPKKAFTAGGTLSAASGAVRLTAGGRYV